MIRDPSDGSVKVPLARAPELLRSSCGDLKAKHGDNYGLSSGKELKTGVIEPAPTADQLRHHYAHYGLGFQPKRDDAA